MRREKKNRFWTGVVSSDIFKITWILLIAFMFIFSLILIFSALYNKNQEKSDSVYPNVVFEPCLKTECEKGNPDYYEESEYIEVDTTTAGHKECKLKSGWFCPGAGFVDLPCNKTTGNCILDSGLGLEYIGCEYKKNVCLSLSNKTICNKKWNTK